jgi:hypothetical protein
VVDLERGRRAARLEESAAATKADGAGQIKFRRDAAPQRPLI